MEMLKIRNYQLVEKIAEGGMGVVYKALDIRSENIVAVKTLEEKVNKDSETFIRF